MALSTAGTQTVRIVTTAQKSKQYLHTVVKQYFLVTNNITLLTSKEANEVYRHGVA